MILNVKNKISDIFISMLHFIYGILKTGGFYSSFMILCQNYYNISP